MKRRLYGFELNDDTEVTLLGPRAA